MKKYNKPEIETLALETVDVIAASAVAELTYQAVAGVIGTDAPIKGSNTTLSQFTTEWNW